MRGRNIEEDEKMDKNNIINNGKRYKGKEGMNIRTEGTASHSGFSSSGQMFLICAILILIALIAIKNLLGVYATFEEKRFEEIFTLDKQLRNVKNEIRNTVGIATLRNDVNLSGIQYLYNFSNFTVSDMDAELLYAFIFSNASNQIFGITVANFLKDTINITINATDSTPAGYTFTINNSINASRQFNSSINGTINITLTYSKQNDNVTERFPILVSTQRFDAIFFDLTLFSRDEFVRSKEIHNRTW